MAVDDKPGVSSGECCNYYGFPSWSPPYGAYYAAAPPLPPPATGYSMPWNPYAVGHPAMVHPSPLSGRGTHPHFLPIGGAGGTGMLGPTNGQVVVYDTRNVPGIPPKLTPSMPSIQLLPVEN